MKAKYRTVNLLENFSPSRHTVSPCMSDEHSRDHLLVPVLYQPCFSRTWLFDFSILTSTAPLLRRLTALGPFPQGRKEGCSSSSLPGMLKVKQWSPTLPLCWVGGWGIQIDSFHSWGLQVHSIMCCSHVPKLASYQTLKWNIMLFLFNTNFARKEFFILKTKVCVWVEILE